MSKIIKHKLLTLVAVLGLVGLMSGMLFASVVSSASHILAITSITMDPATATNVVGEEHTVTATVVGVHENLDILFDVTGANTTSGVSPTNEFGVATFAYTGTNLGTDTITACIHDGIDACLADGIDFCDALGCGEVGDDIRGVATKHWVLEVDKVYTHTNVCFEKDNDHDGVFDEDGADPAHIGGASDPSADYIDCPDLQADSTGATVLTSMGTLLPNEDGSTEPGDVTGDFVLDATVSGGKVKNYTPGQYYAKSTVTLEAGHGQDLLTIWEDYNDCIGDPGISLLNPAAGTGGGNVVLVEDIGGVLFQIADSNGFHVGLSDPISIDTVNNMAHAVVDLSDDTARTFMLYVKFKPGLKKEVFSDTHSDRECVNSNTAVGVIDPDILPITLELSVATATLHVHDLP
jgi:hypothetical protein